MVNNYTLKLPESYEYLKDELSVFLDSGIDRVADFFNIDNYDKIRIFVYDKEDEYRKYNNPPYEIGTISGCFSYDNVRIYIDLNKLSKERLFTCILHETTHVLYLNYVQEKGKEKRIVWFDEGLATYLSGQRQRLENNDYFIEYLNNKIYGEGKIIPDISYLHIHGNKFGNFVDTENNSYNGYDWAYLMIRYLVETMPKEELDELMRSYKKIIDIESTIIEDTDKYFKSRIKKR